MPSFIGQDRTFEVPKLNQRVLVDGVLREDIEATQISTKLGVEGSTANLIAPIKYWDDIEQLKGKSIQIAIGYDGAGENYEPKFNGMIADVSRNAAEQLVELGCISWLGVAQKCYIGQGIYDSDRAEDNFEDGGLKVTYWQYADDNETVQWTPASIIRDFFAATQNPIGPIGADWRLLFELGDLTDLQAMDNDVIFGKFEFNKANLPDALKEIMDRIGNVSLKETFLSNGKTRIDIFSETLAPTIPIKNIKVARPEESSIDSNVISILHSESFDNTYSRFIAFGNNRQFMVSMFSFWGDGFYDYVNTTTFPLSSFHYEALESDPTVYTDQTNHLGIRRNWNANLEAECLLDPGVMDDEDRGFPQHKDVFRKFYLPEWFKNIEIEKNNFIRLVNPNDATDTKQLEIQVFQIRPNLQYYESDVTFVTTDELTDNQLEDWATLGELYPTVNFHSKIPAGTMVYCFHPTEENPTSEAYPNGYPPELWGTPEEVSAEFNLNEGWFRLKEPAICVGGSIVDVDDGLEKTVYLPMVVVITLTYKGTRLVSDKTSPDVVVSALPNSGLVQTFSNDHILYQQITNRDFPIYYFSDDQTVGRVVWYNYCIYSQNTDAGTVITLFDDTNTADEILVVDKSAKLDDYTLKALAEQARPQETYSITTPYYTSSFQIGDTINITGEDSFNFGHHIIRAVNYNLTDNHSITISTDNNVPLLYSNILGGTNEGEMAYQNPIKNYGDTLSGPQPTSLDYEKGAALAASPTTPDAYNAMRDAHYSPRANAPTNMAKEMEQQRVGQRTIDNFSPAGQDRQRNANDRNAMAQYRSDQQRKALALEKGNALAKSAQPKSVPIAQQAEDIAYTALEGGGGMLGKAVSKKLQKFFP
jgi:hypothetical protein